MKLFQRQFAKRPSPHPSIPPSKLVQATDRWKVGNKVHNAMFYVEREESPLLVTCSYREGLVCVFSINARKCKEVHHFGGLFTSVIQHHNTLFIAKETAGKQNYIVSFHVPTRACRYRYVGHTHRITDLVVNASVLYSTSADTTCCLWQLSDTEDNPFCVRGPSPLSFIDVSERRRSMFIGETPGRPLTETSPKGSQSRDGTALYGEASSSSNSEHAAGVVSNGDSKQRDNAGGEGGDGECKKDISQRKDERIRDDEEHRQDPGVCTTAAAAEQCTPAAAPCDAAIPASAVDLESARVGEGVVMEKGTGDHTESTDEEFSASTSDSLLMAAESDASTSDDGFAVGDDVLQVGEDEEEDGEEESDGDDIEEGDEWHPNRSAQPPPESVSLGTAETTSGTSLPSSAKPQGASKSRRHSTRARMVPVSPFRVLRGHRCPIACVAVSARSLYQPTTAYTGSTDGTICIWNAETEELLHTLRNHAGPISTLSVQSYRGRYVLYSASLDGTVRCWDAEDGDELQVYDLGGPVSSIKIGRSCFYAILLNQIIACNIKTGKWENKFSGHVHLIRDWYADAYQIITVSNDGTIRRWDRKTAECLQVFVGHKSPVISLTVPTGSSVPQLLAEQPAVLPSSFYSCGEDSTIQQWPLSKLSDDDAVDHDFSPLRTAVEHDDATSSGALRVTPSSPSQAQKIKAGERENISVRFEECKPLPAEDFQLEDTTEHDVRIAHYGETERSYPDDAPVRKKKKTSYALLNRSFSLSSLGGSRPKRRTAPSERRNERVATYTAEWKGGSGATRSSPSFSHEPLLIGCRLPTLSAADELLSDSRPPPSSPAPRRPEFDRAIASADDIVRVDAAPST